MTADLKIGDKVEVLGQYANDWTGIDAWVAGIRVHDTGEGLDIAIAEQWPIPPRHSRGYLGWTDGFRPEELRKVADGADETAECPHSPTGQHQVDTSMESGPNNCFLCEQPMGGKSK